MHKYKKLIQRGFALPTLIIAGTILMIVGASTLVASTSITKTLQDQRWNRLADEAAQAGVAFASSCLEKNRTNYWTSNLTPGSSCSGGSGGYVAQEAGKWSSTFTVATPSSTSGNPTTATVTGTVTVNPIAAIKTYTSNKTVIVKVDQSLQTSNLNSSVNNLTGEGYSYYLNSVTGWGAGVCTIASDKQAYCAGRNNDGQLGDGTTTNRSTPVKFNLPSGLSAVSVTAFGQTAGGLHHVCVLASDNQAYCSGNNSRGELGDGTTTNRSTPVKFNLPSGVIAYKLVASENTNTCVITLINYYLYCAGSNTGGELGDGTTTNRSTPVQFGTSNAFIKIMNVTDATGGQNATCIVASLSGAAKNTYCAGSNPSGLLGNGNTTDQSVPANFIMPSGQPPQNLVHGSGGGNTCVLGSYNALYCAGGNTYGQLGDGTTTNRSTPVKFNAPGAVKMGTQGGLHACALVYNSVPYCAGWNTYGQLGDGTTTSRSTPVQFVLPFVPAVSVMASHQNTCALGSNGDLYCAGRNNYGQLGDGTTTNRSTPVKFNLPSGVKVLQFATLDQNICANGDDGQLYCAGSNAYGQLGNGSTASIQNVPVRFQLP